MILRSLPVDAVKHDIGNEGNSCNRYPKCSKSEVVNNLCAHQRSNNILAVA